MVGKIISTGKDISIQGASADGSAYKIHLPILPILGVTDVDDTIYSRRLLS